MQLRPYQIDGCNQIIQAWNAGHRNIMFALATGAGKTPVFSSLLHQHGRASAAIAHRSELVVQMSMTLAKFGVRHRVIAPTPLMQFLIHLQYQELNASFIDTNAPVGVVSIDTLRSRYKNGKSDHWTENVSLWVQDEAHHVLKVNKWGMVDEIFPRARGLGVTATPYRADGNGLGRHHEGLFDCLIEGPSVNWMIEQGYLTDYRLVAPPSDMDLSKAKIGTTGDYSAPALKIASQESHIVGDVVKHYLKFAQGEQGITFATDVETAGIIANNFNDSGVPAVAIDAKTPANIRVELLRRFKIGELKQLVNVDIFGEGFDLPALYSVSGARPTQSLSLAWQQFGRMMRPIYADGYDLNTQEGRLSAIANGPKPKGLYIDHTGNFASVKGHGRHQLPDSHREWTLDRRDKNAKSNTEGVIPITACPSCFNPYERYHSKCPFCGYKPEPESRAKPEFVDGDLFELSPEALAEMRGVIRDIGKDPYNVEAGLIANGADKIAARSIRNNIMSRQEAHKTLRVALEYWGGWQNAKGHSDDQAYRIFYHRFGIDVGTAQGLSCNDALKLEERIRKDMMS